MDLKQLLLNMMKRLILAILTDLVTSCGGHLERRHDTLLHTLIDDVNYKKLYGYEHVKGVDISTLQWISWPETCIRISIKLVKMQPFMGRKTKVKDNGRKKALEEIL